MLLLNALRFNASANNPKRGIFIINYFGAKKVRFSCAYLFRIYINGKYLLVRDEQGRNTFQPVGGVYKYTDADILDKMNAAQCMRFGTGEDLDCDLRIIMPRNKVSKFKRWFNSEKGRETQANLYREFKEEILDRIDGIDYSVFDEIKYRCCGTHIESSRMGERDMQVRIADVVELYPTPQQEKVFLKLMEHESNVYYFATKEEIYELGRTGGNQIQTISNHTYKILFEEEKRLKRNKHSGKFHKARSQAEIPPAYESWPLIEKADTLKEFTFISYNSTSGKNVWTFCDKNSPPLNNLWIDRKNVAENWIEDVRKALNSETCNKAILFINKDYLIRSTACYEEARLILENKIPHIVVLVDIDHTFVKATINNWIHSDLADKDKLRLFKTLFHYDDDTGHINVSMFALGDPSCERLLQCYSNL
ncbi:MAG: hypothetical protein IJ946_08765 [Clostridia bacterium]|nr:hypothetical protein [Clostridia bacterium]